MPEHRNTLRLDKIALAAYLLLAIVPFIQVGCSPDVESEQEDSLVEQDPPERQAAPLPGTTGSVASAKTSEYQTIGVIRNITPSRNYIVLAHEDIPGYMGPMTMPFAVRDSSLIRGLAIGDSVAVKLILDIDGMFVSEAALMLTARTSNSRQTSQPQPSTESEHLPIEIRP